MRQFITLLAITVLCIGLEAGDPSTKKRLPVMTWYHPVLEPGVSALTLVCTVQSVEKSTQYESPYWHVTLRIDERIQVAPDYTVRMQKVTHIISGDFRERKLGDRVVLFAGGFPYQGDDFVMPCWSGTATDLGVLLHPTTSGDSAANDRLLQALRGWAKDGKDTAERLEAFSHFCPSGVAHYLIQERRIQESKDEK